VTANRELAARLVAQADDAMRHRKALLCAAVALAESSTIAGARKILAGWDGPPVIRSAAAGLLDELTRQESP
jgi:hypothetical protein